MVLVLVCFALLIYLWRRNRRQGELVGISTTEGTAKAWADPEKGELSEAAVVASPISKPITALELCETLRQVLGEELAKGVNSSELLRSLNSLERRLAALEPLGHAARPRPESLRDAATAAQEALLKEPPRPASAGASLDTRTPNSSDLSGNSSPRPEDLPGAIAAPVLPPTPPPGSEKVQAPCPWQQPATLEQTPPPPVGPPKMFGPTDKQLQLADPPEKYSAAIDEELSERASLATLQRILGKRDAQTTELHRQLKEARQSLWLQASEARAATARLHALLSDPLKAPAAQAEALLQLREEVKELSRRLGESRSKEQHWSAIAKRQRAFFMQSERMSQEGTSLLRRHPAGDIFLAPSPVIIDDEDATHQPSWDVGTSHCNPYCVDSWPFEPNVLAQRASVEPNLQNWAEEDEVDEDNDEDPAVWEEDVEDQPADEMLWRQSPKHVGRVSGLPPSHGIDDWSPGGSATTRSL